MSDVGHGGLGYRPHLDGLRGVAILLVVLYHLGVPGLDSGFIGVDVFFALSGFLILGLVRAELERTGRFFWVDFFGRRAARLLPAALLMVLVLSVASFFLLSPGGERQSVAKALVAALASAGNIYYWKVAPASYFAPVPGASQLLLHTWSLGVEEQFYLLLPVCLVVTGWVSRRLGLSLHKTVGSLLALGVAASLGVAAWLAQSHPTAGFYMLPSRAYELGAGGLVAWYLPARGPRRRTSAVLGGLGACGLVGALAWQIPSDAYPGLWALLPVGAALGMVLGGESLPALALLLHSHPMVHIGRISYGWYLWHWPLLVLADVLYLAPAPMSWRVVSVLLALALAEASHRWCETPLRRAGRRHPARTLWVGVTALLCVAFVPLAVGAQAKFIGPTGRWVDIEAENTDYPFLPDRCRDPAGTAGFMRDTDAICELTSSIRGSSAVVAVWGDSHAWAWLPAVKQAVHGSARVWDASSPGCVPGLVSVSDDPTLSEATRATQQLCAESNALSRRRCATS